MTKLTNGRFSTLRSIAPKAALGRTTTFTVAELIKRYPDGNIPDVPGKEERRVRKLARRRLAEAGTVPTRGLSATETPSSE